MQGRAIRMVYIKHQVQWPSSTKILGKLAVSFPASRSLFSFSFAGLTSRGKDTSACHGSKLTVLSMLGGYLATKINPHLIPYKLLCGLT